MKVLFDTNILIDYLNGIPQAQKEIDRFKKSEISILTKMEVLVGAKGEDEDQNIRSFLSRFEVIPLDNVIAELAIQIRRSKPIKLPDAIIYATAKSRDRLLVTRNTKDFDPDGIDVRCPYVL